jgi:hypothetical protein
LEDNVETKALDQAARFVEFFADGWRIGATQPERFFEHFEGRLTADAVMIQPLSRLCRGPQGLRKLFEPLFAVMPGLRGEVLRWGATGDGVLIELALCGTVRGRCVEWTAVDRIILRDDLIAERRSYFDPLPLVMALLSRPRASLKLLAMLLARKETR